MANPLSSAKLWCNCEIVDSAEALIHAQDRGFRFGDGVFETIPVSCGIPYQFERHIARLQAGLDAIRIDHPTIEWKEAVKQLMHANAFKEGFIRIAVSRGVGSSGYRPTADEPTIIIETVAALTRPDHATLWLSAWRKPSSDALPVNFKLAQGMNSTLALLEAQDHGCSEALLLNSENHLCEAASGNLFWIKDNTLFTPSLASDCLEGITRETVLRISHLPTEEVQAPLEALEYADSVFLTNCAWGVLPVTTLKPPGWHWQAHDAVLELAQRYQDDKDDFTRSHAPDWQ